MLSAAAPVRGNPLSSLRNSIVEQVENNTNIILQRVEQMVEQRVSKLLDKVYTLDLVAETLMNATRHIQLNTTFGTVGDLGERCLSGFRSFPGLNKCY